MELKVNDIVQISPEWKNENFRGCLVIVTEIKSWGIQGYVDVPGQGQAYIRVPTEEFERCGRAGWTVSSGEDDV